MQYCAEAVMETSMVSSREQAPWLIVGSYICTYGQERILHAHGPLGPPDSGWEQFLRYKQRKEREWGWTNTLITRHYRLATDTYCPNEMKGISVAPQDKSGKPCLWILEHIFSCWRKQELRIAGCIFFVNTFSLASCREELLSLAFFPKEF